MKRLTFVMFGLAAFCCQPALADETSGWGDNNCGSLVEYYDANGSLTQEMVTVNSTWMRGFLTGANYAHAYSGEARAELAGLTDQTLINAVMRYCRQAPDHNLHQAGWQIFRELSAAQ